jgi:hypothetical protein
VIPYALFAAVVGTISNGLYSTFSPTTSTAQWVGYQVLNGFGRGVGMPIVKQAFLVPYLPQPTLTTKTQALVAVQAALSPADIPMGNSIVIFVQTLGTAITLTVSSAIFQGSLKSELPKQAPLADAAALMAAGATRFRDIVGERDLSGVLTAYSLAIDRVFYLAAAVSGLGVFTSLFLGWVDVRRRERPGDNEDIRLDDISA